MSDDPLSPEAPALGLLEASPGHLDSLRSWLQAEHEGLMVRTIRGSRSRTVAMFFDEVAAACQFPSFFGHNWMAFDECTDDLCAETGASCVLLVSESSQLLVDEAEGELEKALKTWVTTAEHWRNSGNGPRMFRVIFQDHGYTLSLLQARLDKSGLGFFHARSPVR